MTNETLTVLTPAEQETARDLIESAHAGLEKAVAGLTPAQWEFKPALGTWSILEIIEHLAVMQDRIHRRLHHGSRAELPAERQLAALDRTIITQIPIRSSKFSAPESVQPNGRWTPEEAMQNLAASFTSITEFLLSSDALRQFGFEHPVFGPMDAYQWVLAVASHAVRHTAQILEVKADANWPSSTPA